MIFRPSERISISIIPVKNINYFHLCIFSAVFLKKKVQPLVPIIDEIICGLDYFDLMKTIKSNQDIFQYLFTPNKFFDYDYNSFIKALHVSWSENGSNKKHEELRVYRNFLNLIQEVLHEGM